MEHHRLSKHHAKRMSKKHFFFILAFAVWFVFRVGTRPTRIIYPCQQGFIAYLSMIIPITFLPAGFSKQIKNKLTKTSLSVIILLVIVFIGGFYFNEYFGQPDFVYIDKSPSKIMPIRSISSISQNRVISMHSSDATTWDFSCSGSSCPYYGSDAYIDQTVVDSMVDTGLMQLTGTSDILSAWQEIIPDYSPGKKIAVKVNFNAANGWVDTDTQIDAIPQPMNALIKGLKVLGFQEQDIWIYDASRLIPDRYRNEIKAHYPNVKFFANQGNGADVQAVTKTSSDPYATVDLSQFPGTWATKLPDQVVNADYLIDMPIIKAHSIAGITLSFKNHYGTAYNMEAHTYINPDTDDPTKNPLVTVWENPHIGGKTVLIIGDAIYGGFGYSADIARWNSFGNDAPKMLFFSVNPVAIDSVMYDYLLREESAGGVSIKQGSGDLLQLAENHGIGIYEHWNNNVDRQYPNIEYIELELGLECTPGYQEMCVTSLPGVCADGIQTCLPDGSGYGPCIQNEDPVPEICEDGLDNDCDYQTDETDCSYICGDVQSSGNVDIDDVMYLIDYIFTGGPEPQCTPIEECADADLSGNVDIDDIIYLTNYIFLGGPAPCNPDKSYTASGHEDWTQEDVEDYLTQVQKTPSKMSRPLS